MSRHGKPRRGRWQSLFLWHRYLGLASALFVLQLAITGLILNHSGALKLDGRHMPSSWLLDWYDVRVPAVVSFAARDHWLSQLGDRLYFDEHEVLHAPALLLGVVNIDTAWAIGLQHTLLLVTDEGELIERLGESEGLPAGMRRLGRDRKGRLIIDAADGYYQTDSEFLDWQEMAAVDGIDWARPMAMPVARYESLRQQYRASSLSLERVILDLHSGRIFGAWGIYVMDAAAICLLLLALIGVWVWASRRHKQRSKVRKGGRAAG